jgi:hypothetical protein
VPPRIVLAAAVAAAACAAAPARAADAQRGAALYGTSCGSCHTQSVHGREKRAARDFDEIRGWVKRWSSSLRLRWTADEVEDVTLFLNDTYYKYPCPPQACRVVSLAGAAR